MNADADKSESQVEPQTMRKTRVDNNPTSDSFRSVALSALLW